MEILTLKKITAYTTSFELSNEIWRIVIQWAHFPKSTVGHQLVRSADSISANIAEGFGRYHKKYKIKFYRYSMGSILVTIYWIEKAKARNLISKEDYEKLSLILGSLPKLLNHLFNFTNAKLKY